MEWGEHEARLTDLAEKGMDIPALDRKPDIAGLEWIWEAFWKLSTCRSFGMGAGPIPWWVINKYAMDECDTWEGVQHFEFCIMVMDREFLAYQDKKREAQSGNRN